MNGVFGILIVGVAIGVLSTIGALLAFAWFMSRREGP